MQENVIGTKLRALRGGKSRKEVALANEISKSTLAMYECGKRIPRDEIKKRLAHYFGVNVEELFFGT